MTGFLAASITVALAACWLILWISKIGFREWMQVNAPKLVSEMFSCDFCLSWWTCLLLSICLAIAMLSPVYVLCAVIATPITRYLIN